MFSFTFFWHFLGGETRCIPLILCLFTEGIESPPDISFFLAAPVVPFRVSHDVRAVLLGEPAPIVRLEESPVLESGLLERRLKDPLALLPSVRQTQPELLLLSVIPFLVDFVEDCLVFLKRVNLDKLRSQVLTILPRLEPTHWSVLEPFHFK